MALVEVRTLLLAFCMSASLATEGSLPARAEDSAATPAPAAPAPAPASPAAAAVPAAPKPAPASPAAAASVPVVVPLPPAIPGAVATPADPSLLVPTLPAKPKPKRIARPAPASEYALPTDTVPTLQPNTFYTTAKASERYAAIADAGGWPTLPAGVLGPKSKGASVAALRLRLSIEGDLPAGDVTKPVWDAALTDAVKHYQERLGLRQTGIVAGATLKALNVPAKVRFKQLASSAQRLAGITFPFDDRYVVVNIPSTSVEAVENGAVVRRFVAIVGDPDHQSPEVQTKVAAINLNPTWTVPVSIIKKEIIPRMRRDPGYLSRERIRILDGKGHEIDPESVDWKSETAANFTLRQDPGAGNSLGTIRINMPNKFSVYMHDTPGKRLFGADYRFLSHGCVRVSGVYDLAQWLLQGTGGDWSAAAMKSTKERKDIPLAKPVPVIWVYLTGWAAADGTVHFRDDVYGIDTVGDEAVQASVAQ
jgi:murein L,D-transpeptidase YcbB/YkuD